MNECIFLALYFTIDTNNLYIVVLAHDSYFKNQGSPWHLSLLPGWPGGKKQMKKKERMYGRERENRQVTQ